MREEEVLINGEPWRWVLVPESLITEVYGVIGGKGRTADPATAWEQEQARLEFLRAQAPTGSVERRRLTNLLSRHRRLRRSA